MAEVTIITRYLADKTDLQAKVDQIIIQQKKLAEGQKVIATDQQKANVALKASADARKKLLQEEIVVLKQLQVQSKLAFTVPEIKDFNNKIAESKRNIALLKGEVGQTGGIFDNLKSQLAGVGTSIIAAFSIGAIVNFGKASLEAFFEAEKSAKLLEVAIKNVGGGDDSAVGRFIDQSKELQKVTIFSDEQIQNAQTLAFQFGLTQKQVEDLIPVIADFASATGQDLQTALESVLRGTEGQARGLKVYGIEVKNTGDRTKDLAQITDQLTAKFQGQAEVIGNTATGAIAKFNNQLDDLQEKIGAAITRNLLAPLVDGLSSLVNTFDELSNTDLENVTKQLDEQAKATANLTENISPLLDRYDELNSKTTLSADEQKELEQIIIQVGDALPETITGFDQYGKALDISSKAARDAIQAQKDLTASLNEQKILETQKQFDQLSLRLKSLVADLNSGTTSVQQLGTSLASTGATSVRVKLLPADIAEFKKEADLLAAKVRGLELQLKSLRGEPLTVTTEARTAQDINNLEKLEQKLAALQLELKQLPLTEFGVAIDPAQKDKILKEIADTQKLIDEITGKAQEERNKKAQEQADKLLKIEQDNSEKLLQLRIKSAEDLAAIQAVDDPIAKLDAEFDKQLQNAVRVFNLTSKSVQDRANLKETLSNIEIGFEKLISDATIKIAEDTAKKLKEINETNAKEDLDNTLASIDLVAAQQKLRLTEAFKQREDFSKEAAAKLAQEIAAVEIQAEIVKNQEIIKSNATSAAQKIQAQQKIIDLIIKGETELTQDTQEQNELRVQSYVTAFNQITDVITAALSSFSTLTRANTDQQIEQLQEISNAQLEAIDAEEERLQQSRDSRLISEKSYEDQSAQIKQKRIVAEKKLEAETKEIKRKQALLDREIAIANILLNTARAIVAALPNIPLSIVVGAIGAIELATAIAVPLPKFKEGTKGKRDSGLAVVGEAGQEIINLPEGSQVLPNTKYRQNRKFISAMFDDELDSLIHKEYILPAITKERREIINTYTTEKLKEFTNYDFITKQVQIAPILIEKRTEVETQKEQQFFKNIVSSVINNNITKTDKSEFMTKEDYINAERYGLRGQKMAYADYLAEKIAEKMSNDPRRN